MVDIAPKLQGFLGSSMCRIQHVLPINYSPFHFLSPFPILFPHNQSYIYVQKDPLGVNTLYISVIWPLDCFN